MTDNSQPNPSVAPQPPRPEPNCALLAMCVECGEGIELPLPIDNQTIGLLLARRGWFISVLSPPGQGLEALMVFGPLCTACAQKVYPPEVFVVAEQRRQQLLQAAAQSTQVPR
jgi:hypothetical protein